MTKRLFKTVLFLFCALPNVLQAQGHWQNVDSLFQPLPSSIHVFVTHDPIEGKPNIAYYVSADLKDKSIDFTTQVGNAKDIHLANTLNRNKNLCW